MVTTVESSQSLDLLQLLDRVEHGERFVITRRGQAIAELVPTQSRAGSRPVSEVIASIKAAREHRPRVTQQEIREMREEGCR